MEILTKAVEWVADKALGYLAKRSTKKDYSHEKFIQDSYRQALHDLTKQYERNTKGLMQNIADQSQIIESYKGRQVNGKEMSEWQDREAELGQQLLKSMKKVLELETQLMFCMKLNNKNKLP